MAYLELRTSSKDYVILTLYTARGGQSYLVPGSEAPVAVSDTPGDKVLGIFKLSKGGWVLVSPDGVNLSVNGHPVGPLKMLSHADEIRVKDTVLVFRAETTVVLTADSPILINKMRCAYTLTPFVEGDRVVTCPRCGTPHLEEAWLESGFCSGLHCAYRVQQPSSAEESTSGHD